MSDGGRAWRLTDYLKVLQIIEFERFDNLRFPFGDDDYDTVEGQCWIAVIDDFVRVSQVWVWFEYRVATRLRDDASRSHTV